MPIYEYCCPECETKFDLLRPFSQADAPAVCPKCHHEGGRRLVSAFASFSKDSSGSTTPISGGGGGCSGCSGGSCATCH